MREIVRHVRVRFDELATRRIMAVALFRNGQADDFHAGTGHGGEQPSGILGRNDELAKRADDFEIFPAGASHVDGIESVLRLQCVVRVGGPQARAANRPVRLTGREAMVKIDRLMRAVKRADAEVHDTDANHIEIEAGTGDIAWERIESGP